jgi:hypothetical protein
MLMPSVYGMAAAIEAMGSGAPGSTLDETLESTALLSAAPGAFAASSARRLNADTRKMADAAVAINLALNLIVASRTARRAHQKPRRRANSMELRKTKRRIT